MTIVVVIVVVVVVAGGGDRVLKLLLMFFVGGGCLLTSDLNPTRTSRSPTEDRKDTHIDHGWRTDKTKPITHQPLTHPTQVYTTTIGNT